MRDLTREELEEYFDFVHADEQPCGFHREQASLVGEVAAAHGLLIDFAKAMRRLLNQGVSLDTVVLSYWVWAFQMGRECESRLLTLALKGGAR